MTGEMPRRHELVNSGYRSASFLVTGKALIAPLCELLPSSHPWPPPSWDPSPPRSYSPELGIISSALNHCLQLCLRICSNNAWNPAAGLLVLAPKCPGHVTQSTDPTRTHPHFKPARETTELSSQAFCRIKYCMSPRSWHKSCQIPYCVH